MPTVSTAADSYQSLADIRDRITFRGHEFFDNNAELRFDELLVRLETESRGIFETLWGDETVLEETGRTDVIRTTDDAAMPLVYPITDVTEVEYKISQGSDWETLDTDHYDHTAHRLVLARRPNINTLRHRQRGNVIATDAQRAAWRDLAAKIRVTYDRGFANGAPADVKSIQIQLIENFLRKRKQDSTVSAGSPEDMAAAMETNMVVTDEIRSRVADVTSPGRATFSV